MKILWRIAALSLLIVPGDVWVTIDTAGENTEIAVKCNNTCRPCDPDPISRADIDGDGDVDLRDYATLQALMTGPK